MSDHSTRLLSTMVDALASDLLDEDATSIEQVDEFLRDLGEDPADIAQKGREFVTRLLTSQEDISR